jgi:hypothetical protein
MFKTVNCLLRDIRYPWGPYEVHGGWNLGEGQSKNWKQMGSSRVLQASLAFIILDN